MRLDSKPYGALIIKGLKIIFKGTVYTIYVWQILFTILTILI